MDKLLTPEAIDTSSSPVFDDPLGVPLKDRLILSDHNSPTIHIDTVSDCAMRILEIFPDVEPEHVTVLVTDTIQTYGTGTVERVLHTLFDDPKYPKVQKRGNRKEDSNSAEEVEGCPSEQINCVLNYGDHNRPFVGGPNYAKLTFEHLKGDFPLVPIDFINGSLQSLNGLYAPTYFLLLEQLGKVEKQRRWRIKLPFWKSRLLFRPLTSPSLSSVGTSKELPHDEEFSKERAWLIQEVMDREGSGIECGCCFAAFRFHEMVQCCDAHLFCITCMTTYASTLLNEHFRIQCIDRSGCTALIPESEVQRFLPEEVVLMWESLSQHKEIMEAGLEGLAECPFCRFVMVIDNKEEKLFSCGNERCGVVSCRVCKKPDHLPKRCEDVADDILRARHTIEDAMSRALIRYCPKCQTPHVKVYGCCSVTCQSCSAPFCYICRRLTKAHGFRHNCPEDVIKFYNTATDTLDAHDVKEAHQRALEEYKHKYPDVDEQDIKIDFHL